MIKLQRRPAKLSTPTFSFDADPSCTDDLAAPHVIQDIEKHDRPSTQDGRVSYHPKTKCLFRMTS